MIPRSLTRPEFVVALVIGAVALGLLVPFLLHQRTAARGITCQDRLARLAIAIEQYDTREGLLPGYRQPLTDEILGSWVAPLLPVLSTPRPAGEPNIQAAHEALLAGRPAPARLPELLCPALARYERDAPLAFIANCGLPDHDGDPELPPDWQANGLFFNHAVEPARRVTTSLAWLSEHDGRRATLLLAENVDAVSWRNTDEAGVGFVWVPHLEDGEPTPLPTVWPINQQRGRGDGTIKFARPSSEHPGGAHVALASGTTQLLSDRIDYLVYQRLMTAAGSDVKVAGADEYLPAPWRHSE